MRLFCVGGGVKRPIISALLPVILGREDAVLLFCTLVIQTDNFLDLLLLCLR
jgi:hypothetical protein